jgi:hypothetical protein
MYEDALRPVAVWMKCFECMERKAEKLKKEHPKVAELWTAKLEQCKACKEEYFADTKRYENMTVMEGWANTLRRCTTCLLDDLEKIAKHPDEAKVYSELTKDCMSCMYKEMPEVREFETVKA